MSASQGHEKKDTGKPDKPKKLNIFINQKKFEVEVGEMTARQLLQLIDESPEQVVLALKDKGQLTKYPNLDETIPLQNGMHFVTMNTQPTPVS